MGTTISQLTNEALLYTAYLFVIRLILVPMYDALASKRANSLPELTFAKASVNESGFLKPVGF